MDAKRKQVQSSKNIHKTVAVILSSLKESTRPPFNLASRINFISISLSSQKSKLGENP